MQATQLTEQLTQHFSLQELTASVWAADHGVPNILPDSLRGNALRLGQLMEQVREVYGKPITVLSGYRSPKVNTGVGGSGTSAHLKALACDFHCHGFGTLYMQALAIAASKGLVFDQLILEPTWIHIGLAEAPKKPRGQILTKFKGDPKYYPGLHIKRP